MSKRTICTAMFQIPIVLLIVGFQACLPLGELKASKPMDAVSEAGEEKQQSDKAAQPAKPHPKQPLADRIKAANRPYNYIALDYMSVPEGGDEEYINVETAWQQIHTVQCQSCLLYTSPSPRDGLLSRMPSSA